MPRRKSPRTKRQKEARRRQRQNRRVRAAKSFFAVMTAVYPAVFNEQKPVPLKIDIHKDILIDMPEAGKRKISGFLKVWTNRNRYKAVKALAETGKLPRYDLQGNEVDNA